jgi:hypothetical protein
LSEDFLIPIDLRDLFDGIHGSVNLRERCYSLLNEQPNLLKVRVFLSLLFYREGLYEFAKRELLELKTHGNFPIADRILNSLGGIAQSSEKKIVAEIKF